MKIYNNQFAKIKRSLCQQIGYYGLIKQDFSYLMKF